MDDKRKQHELIQELSELVNELGWVTCMPVGENGMAPGLIIGTREFVDYVTQESFPGSEVTVFSEDPTGENDLIEEPIDPNKKKTTVH